MSTKRVEMFNDYDRGCEFFKRRRAAGGFRPGFYLCARALRSYVDIPVTEPQITVVASSKDPGHGDVFDLLPGGGVEGVQRWLSSGLTSWLAANEKAGRRFAWIELE